MKQVTVPLPLPIWGRLASIADSQGVHIADLLVDAAEEMAAPKTRPGVRMPAEVEARIREMHARNLPGVAIAEELRIPYSTVMGAMKRLNLHPLMGARATRNARRNKETKA